MKTLGNTLSAADLMASIPCTKDVSDLYRMGLDHELTILAVCAQDELIRRAATDYICEGLQDFFDSGKTFKLGTEFAHFIAQSLMAMGDIDPFLSRYGKYIYRQNQKGEDILPMAQYTKDVWVPEVCQKPQKNAGQAAVAALL